MTPAPSRGALLNCCASAGKGLGLTRMEKPSMMASPEVGSRNPSIIRMVVVLPALDQSTEHQGSQQRWLHAGANIICESRTPGGGPCFAPAPLGPSSPKHSQRWISSDSPSTATLTLLPSAAG